MPDVSILLPVYNGARFLDEQLRSIKGQVHENFELLIYDDGSSDGSWDIIDKCRTADCRVIPIRSSCNDGQGYALSRLLERAKSDRIMFADQDDIWEPNKVSGLLGAIGGHSLSYGLSHLVEESGSTMGQTIFDFVGPPISGRDRIDLCFVNTVSGHASLVDRSILDPIIFRLNGNYDRILALAASLVHGIAYAPQSVTYHRLHSGNQVNGSLLGTKKPGRASRGEQLLRLWQALRCLSGLSAISSERRKILREMDQIALKKLSETHSIYYSNPIFEKQMMTLARNLSGDAQVLSVFQRKIRRLSRGSLYPSTK